MVKGMIYAVLLMHLCLVAINYRVSRSWLYPPVVFTLLWSVVLFFLILSGSFFYPISASALLVFLLGSLALSVGGIVSLARKANISTPVLSRGKWTGRVLDASLILLLIMLPFYVVTLRHLSSMSGVSDFWVGLRIQTSSGFRGNGLGVFSYVIMLGNLASLAAVVQLTKSSYSKRKTYILLFVTFLYGIASAARTGTIMLLFSLVLILALRRKLRVKTASLLAITLLVLFVLPAFFLGKGINKKDTILENVVSMRESMQIYFLAGPVAFDQATFGSGEAVPSGKSLIFFKRLFHAVGLTQSAVPSIIYNYTYTPKLTNLYTVYFPYYSDFGLPGVGIAMFALGFILTTIYRAAAGGNPIFIILYSLGFSMLILTSGGDWFLTSVSVWIQATVFSFLLYRVPPLVMERDDRLVSVALIVQNSELPSSGLAR